MNPIEALQERTDLIQDGIVFIAVLLFAWLVIMSMLQTRYERKMKVCTVPNSDDEKSEGTKHNNHIQCGEKTGRLQPVRSSSKDFSLNSLSQAGRVRAGSDIDKANYGGLDVNQARRLYEEFL